VSDAAHETRHETDPVKTTTTSRRAATCAPVAAALLALLGAASPAAAQPGAVRVTEIAPRFHLLTDSGANMVVFADSGGALAAGVHSPSLVGRAREVLRSSGAGPLRYALMMEGDTAAGDAGWGEGMMTMAQELHYNRLRRRARAAASRPGAAPARLPQLGFSQVVQLYFPTEEVHLVHERAGYTSSDVIVHFEKEGLVYLGNTYTSDGYPAVDSARGGRVAGMIATASFFVDAFAAQPQNVEPVVPGRGPVSTLAELRAYRDMLVSVRDRVQALQAAGKTLEEVVAARPTAAHDARWGRGPVKPDEFVAMVYRSVRAERPAPQTAQPAQPAGGHVHGAPPAQPQPRPYVPE
jgi:hypothetical protein